MEELGRMLLLLAGQGGVRISTRQGRLCGKGGGCNTDVKGGLRSFSKTKEEEGRGEYG